MQSPSLKTLAQQTLLQVEKGKDFLPSFVNSAQTKNPTLNLSALARLFGYQSRGHFREMVIGQKNFSLEAAQRISEKLGLSRDERKLLGLKVLRDQEPSKLLDDNISSLTEKIRENGDNNFIFRNRVDEVIFALIPPKPPGVPIAHLCAKANYNRFEVRDSLMHFEKVGAIRKAETNTYVALDIHKITRGLKSINFSRSYQDGISHLANRHEMSQLNADNSLLLHSFFPIAAGKFPELKSKLRELLESFVDQTQVDGDEVVEIMLGAMNLGLIEESKTN